MSIEVEKFCDENELNVMSLMMGAAVIRSECCLPDDEMSARQIIGEKVYKEALGYVDSSKLGKLFSKAVVSGQLPFEMIGRASSKELRYRLKR